MKHQIKKAVIPAAGLGTRFLPATKTVPKEMLTIVDKPLILYIVEECVNAGIEDIILVAGRQKTALEDFFDCSYELEDHLLKSGKTDLLEKIVHIKNMANIISIRQKEALGLGHAVYTSRPAVGHEPFAVLLGDEIMISEEGKPTAIEQLCNTFGENQISTVGVMKVNDEDVHKYGIVEFEPFQDHLMKILNVIEKPSCKETSSRFALPGRYVFTSDIFEELESTPPGKNGEIQLTDPMVQVAQKAGMLAQLFTARRYDAGDKLGYIQANIELALGHPEIGDKLKPYLKQLVKALRL